MRAKVVKKLKKLAKTEKLTISGWRRLKKLYSNGISRSQKPKFKKSKRQFRKTIINGTTTF